MICTYKYAELISRKILFECLEMCIGTLASFFSLSSFMVNSYLYCVLFMHVL